MIFFAFTVPTDKESESYLDIHNVGIESNDGVDLSPTVRPKGRKDYILLYTHNAKLKVKLSDGTERVVDSHCVLFKPSQPQDYSLYPDPEGKLCWIHFNGTFAIDILRKASLYNTFTPVQRSEEIYELFKELVITLRRMEPNYKLICNSLFLKLLFLLSENITEPTEKAALSEEAQKKHNQKRINPAIVYINENLDKNFTLETLASICALSKTSFTHTFSKTLGVSPIAYAIARKLAALDPERFESAAGRIAIKAQRARERRQEQLNHEKNLRTGKKKAEKPAPPDKKRQAEEEKAPAPGKKKNTRPGPKERSAAARQRQKSQARARFAGSRPVKKGKGSGRKDR